MQKNNSLEKKSFSSRDLPTCLRNAKKAIELKSTLVILVNPYPHFPGPIPNMRHQYYRVGQKEIRLRNMKVIFSFLRVTNKNIFDGKWVAGSYGSYASVSQLLLAKILQVLTKQMRKSVLQEK